MKDHQDQLQQLEEKIKSGHTKEVLAFLNQAKNAKIPRALRLPYSELARRSGAPELAIHFLFQIMYPKHAQSAVPPSPEESISYASSLRALGFTNESLDILKKLDEKKHPSVLLQKALLLFSQWKYRESITPLKRYIKSSGITEYQKTIGEVNLLSAYVSAEEYSKAWTLGRNLLEKTRKQKFYLLYGNTLELLSQYYIFTEQYNCAVKTLDEAESILQDFSGIYLLYVKKWKLILQLLSKEMHKDFNNELAYLQDVATKNSHSEILRDLDFFKALHEKDVTSLVRVLAGTPMRSYHLRAEKIFKCKIKIPNRLALSTRESGILDFRDDFFLYRPLLKKFLWVLSKDLYKSISVGQIFAAIYPDEYFNPDSSLKRIDNLSYRLNQHFKQMQIPLFIERSRYSYRLREAENLILYRQMPSTVEIAFFLFKSQKVQKIFKRKDLEEALKISESAAKQLLKHALQTKIIKSINSGPQTRYLFSNHK